MNYLSVCSGIEAATEAWHPLGWTPQAFSEVDKFPSEVLKYHYPHIPNLGDMTNYKEWHIGNIDLLVGGTPCQSFSVAGLRKGLDDPRGNLPLVYLGIAERFRPRWIVWENVPGVFSSYTGPKPPSDLEEGQEWEAEETSDFECFTTALAQLGYGFAYRVLDAQYFGVPQRRRRVFVVGCLGDWRSAAAVLFERHSLQGNTPPSREKGEDVANCFEQRSQDGIAREHGNIAPTLNRMGGGQREPCVVMAHGSCTTNGSRVAPTLDANHDQKRGSNQWVNNGFGILDQSPATVMAHGQGNAEIVSDGDPSLTCNHEAPIAFTQNTRDEVRKIGGDGQIAGALGANEGMKQRTYLAIRTAQTGSNGHGIAEDVSHTLDGANGQAVAFSSNARPDEIGLSNIVEAQTCSQNPAVLQNMSVRRLTPVECERLQGFPDNYTQIPWRGKPAEQCPLGPRYKALGNSMAVPVMRWIGERIEMVENL